MKCFRRNWILIVLLLNCSKSVLKKVWYFICMILEDSHCPLLLVCLPRAVPLMPCLCVSRKWMAATRWPVHPVNNISVGCVWAYLAKSTLTVTLTTHIHLVTTSEWFVFDPISQCKPVDIFANVLFSACFRLFYGVDPDEEDAYWSDDEDWHQRLCAVCSIWMHFISCDITMPALARQCHYKFKSICLFLDIIRFVGTKYAYETYSQKDQFLLSQWEIETAVIIFHKSRHVLKNDASFGKVFKDKYLETFEYDSSHRTVSNSKFTANGKKGNLLVLVRVLDKVNSIWS